MSHILCVCTCDLSNIEEKGLKKYQLVSLGVTSPWISANISSRLISAKTPHFSGVPKPIFKCSKISTQYLSMVDHATIKKGLRYWKVIHDG